MFPIIICGGYFVFVCVFSILNGILVCLMGDVMRYVVFIRYFVEREAWKNFNQCLGLKLIRIDTWNSRLWQNLMVISQVFPCFSLISHGFPRIFPRSSLFFEAKGRGEPFTEGSLSLLSGADWPSCATHTFWRRQSLLLDFPMFVTSNDPNDGILLIQEQHQKIL